jgi:hypothetical protein
MLKSANSRFWKSCTVHGFVWLGVVTGGAGLTGLLDPICGVEGAMTTWAWPGLAAKSMPPLMANAASTRGEKDTMLRMGNTSKIKYGIRW